MSSHKGYGLSVMVQILSATLAGGSFTPIRKRTQGRGDPDNIGHFLMALDPTAFREEGEFEEDLDDGDRRAARVARQCARTSPCSSRESRRLSSREERRAHGIPVPDLAGREDPRHLRAVRRRSSYSTAHDFRRDATTSA